MTTAFYNKLKQKLNERFADVYAMQIRQGNQPGSRWHWLVNERHDNLPFLAFDASWFQSRMVQYRTSGHDVRVMRIVKSPPEDMNEPLALECVNSYMSVE
jgi:hypothetical protein